MPWYVLYTKSNSEKRVVIGLQKQNIEVYCPFVKTKRKWSDRIKYVDVPLFRSYCFVKLEATERGRVFNIQGIVGYLHWLQKPAVVREEEIEQIRTILQVHDHDTIKVETFAVNDKVKVSTGVFEDHQGKVVAIQGRKLVLLLDALQIKIFIDINKTLVEKHRSE